MNRTLSVILVAVLVGPFVGCSGDQSGANSDTTDRENRAEELGRALGVDPGRIQGTLYVDDVGTVIQARNGSDEAVQCTAPGLASGLGQAARVVVITDPGGNEVALGRLSAGRPDTVRERGQEVAVPGTCTFGWSAQVEAELVDGIYTAGVPELGVEARFTMNDARQVALRYDP